MGKRRGAQGHTRARAGSRHQGHVAVAGVAGVGQRWHHVVSWTLGGCGFSSGGVGSPQGFQQRKDPLDFKGSPWLLCGGQTWHHGQLRGLVRGWGRPPAGQRQQFGPTGPSPSASDGPDPLAPHQPQSQGTEVLLSPHLPQSALDTSGDPPAPSLSLQQRVGPSWPHQGLCRARPSAEAAPHPLSVSRNPSTT